MKTQMHLRASSHLFGFAKSLRKNPTKAEEKLWQYLRGNQTGYKYRRQHPLLNYIVDFYCHTLKLVIEIDGDIHLDPTVQLEDENKESSLVANDFMIFRFSNNQVLEEIEYVLKTIYSIQESRRTFLLSLEVD